MTLPSASDENESLHDEIFFFFSPFFWQFPPKDMNKLLKFSLGVMVPKAGRPRGPFLLVNGSLGFQSRSAAE